MTLQPTEALPLYDDPLYWNGPRGYREPGYSDFALNGPRAALVAQELKEHGGKRVLDVGCSMGYLVRRSRWRGLDAQGLDISHYALAHAPQEVQPFLHLGRAHELPFPDHSFDFYVSSGVYEHLTAEEAEMALKEARRVAPRGFISLAALDPLKPQHDDEGHDLLQPLEWWRERMPEGFDVMDDGTPHWLARVPQSLYLATILLKTPFTSSQAVQAVVNELCRRGYVAWAAQEETSRRVVQEGVEGWIIPDLQVPLPTHLDLWSWEKRVGALGAQRVADEIVRGDEVRRGRTG